MAPGGSGRQVSHLTSRRCGRALSPAEGAKRRLRPARTRSLHAGPVTVPSSPGPSGDEALAAAGALGSFFRVEARPGETWTSVAGLIAQPEVLARRAAEVAAVLTPFGGPEADRRVVASLVHLGLVARLVSPPLAAALVAGVVPVASIERVHLELVGSNPLPMALTTDVALPLHSAADLAAVFQRAWLEPIVQPLTQAVRASSAVSQQVLEGNVTSALAGALRMCTAARPELTASADAVLDALLHSGPLAGTGRRRRDGSFVRRSCCLFYRLPGGGTCGDCILDDDVPPSAGRAP